MKQIEIPQIYFEDLEIGASFESAGRTVTEADIVSFAGLSADYNQLHVDAAFAAATKHGERIAHGLLVLSIVSGLSSRMPIMVAIGSQIIGLLNLQCKWKGAVKIGDTVHVRLSVKDLRRTSKGTNGVVTLDRSAVNQRGETVMESEWKLLVSCREADDQ